jgi:hypothetical protein
MESLEKRPKLKKMDISLGMCNVGSLHRAGSLMRVVKGISKYNLDLGAVQEVRWDSVGTKPEGEYTFFYGKENENCELGTGFFLYIRESYQQLRG